MRFTVKRYSAVPTSTDGQVPRSGVAIRPPDGGPVNEEEAFSPPSEEIDSVEPTSLDGLLRQQSNYSTSTVVDAVDKSTSDVQYLKTDQMQRIAEAGRQFAKRQIHRLVYKDGNCNVSSRSIPKRKKRYLVDIFTTLVDMKWRYNLFLFATAFIGSWFFFSFFWLLIAVTHGDHSHSNDTEWEPCVTGVYDFPTALLFSIETQHTIGYGTRAMEPNCGWAMFLLMVQSCFGVFIQSLMTGLVFSKLSRPKHRAQTMMFSKFAVICQRDGEYCLLFRVGDMRRSHIIGTSIRALIVKNRLTKEKEEIPLCQHTLDLETETNFSDNFVFLVWPVTVVHRINSSSPFWEISAQELLTQRFEIIVILEGIVENTGMTTQFRTSYLPAEILWGHRLAPLFTYEKHNGLYEIDFSRFDDVIAITSMPDYSAKKNGEKGLDSTSITREEDYPINFTAPRLRTNNQTGTSLRKILRRRREKRSNTVGDLEEEKGTPTSTRLSIESLSDKIVRQNGSPRSIREPPFKRSMSLNHDDGNSKANTKGVNGNVRLKNGKVADIAHDSQGYKFFSKFRA